MRSVILFILFTMNMMSTMGLATTLMARNTDGHFYSVNENIVYFCLATVIFNIVSLVVLIEKKS